MKKSYSFCPDTSKTHEVSEKLLEARGKYKRISDSKKEILQYLRLKAMHMDLTTGQELFKPKISSFRFRSTERPSRCEYLVKRGMHRRSSSSRLTSANSEKILQRIKHLRFKEIFTQIANFNDNISAETIKNAQISKQLQEILKPITDALERSQGQLNFSEFESEMEEILKILTPEQRNSIIKPVKGNPIIEKSRTRSASPEKFNIYERGLAKLAISEAKLNRYREEKKLSELDSCTFSPVLKKYSPAMPYIELWSFKSESRLNQSSIN